MATPGLVLAADFEVGAVIHPVVVKLGAPELTEGFDEGQMVITTDSDLAQRHFAQGLAKFNTAWEFEAYRHFCEVVKLDPQCLMGYWGISLSLAGGYHEFFAERKAAIDRMLDLLEAEKEGGKDRWNALETGFVQGSGFLLTDGQKVAGRTFEALARKYPANIQARLLALAMQRDGFDRRGNPLLGQRRAEDGIRKLMETHSDDLSVMAFWINTRCQNPGGAVSLREEVLPVARKLAKVNPGYAPFQLILAEVEARCGNFDEGVQAASRATLLYQAYLEKQGVAIYDCDGLIRAQLYQADLLFRQGKRKESLAIAQELASRRVDEDRVFSKGASMLMWEGRTLGARLMAAGTTREEFVQGQDIMGSLKEEEWFKEKSFALYYRDALAFYLAVRGAIADGQVEIAKKLYDQFLLRVQGLEKTLPLASKTSSYSNWMRAMGTISMLLPELRGILADLGEGATKLTAGTWFRSALDRQRAPANLLPPNMPYPMEWRLGVHEAGLEKYAKAASWYLQGLDRSPNHPLILADLAKVAEKLGKEGEAAALRKQIEEVTGRELD